jgi:ABC-type lipoprotein release transport system permease subunit
MKNIAIFTIFFLASLAIGATPILIGIALVYFVAWFLSRGGPSPATTKPTPPPFGGISRKLGL